MFRRFIVPLVLCTLPACIQEPSVPKLGGQSVELQIHTSASQLARGEADTITVTAINHYTDQIRIIFASSCQILAYVRDQSGQTVVPKTGHQCVPLPSALLIPAEGTVDRTFVWLGGSEFSPPGSATRLPAGDYYITASMNADGFSVPAFAVRVTLLP